MAIAEQLARLTPRTAPIIPMPPGGEPEVTNEMIAISAATTDSYFAYHLVMGKYTDSLISQRRAVSMITTESIRIWQRARRPRIKKLKSFILLTILAHATHFNRPEGNQPTAAAKARFCRMSESQWHAHWGRHYTDLMLSISVHESMLLRWISRNIYYG